MKLHLSAALLSAIFLLPFSSMAQSRVDETFSGIKEIEVKGGSADVEIIGRNTGKVQLTGELAVDDEDDRDEYKIRHERHGDRLEIWIEKPSKMWSWSWSSSKGKSFIRLEVPSRTRIEVDNSSGNVEVKNIDEDLEVEVSSGNIDIQDVKAELKVEASSGNIYLSDIDGDIESETSSGRQTLNNIRGNIEAEASSGSIRVTNAKGNAELQTSSGQIRLTEVEGRLAAKSSSGGIVGSEVELREDSEFKSSSGSIRIDLVNDPDDIDFDLHASSGSLKAGSSQGKGDLVINNRAKIKIYGKSTSGSQRYY
ncbi:MAG: DUF4097 family beta strand repeat-containing protein [Cyclobacteriaceae bacterium]